MSDTLRIARKELLLQMRNKRTLMFMIAFPIVLILILGTALSNAFSTDIKVDDMKVLYKLSASSPELTDSWKQFMSVGQQQGIKFTQASPGEDGTKAIQDDQFTAYADIGNNGIRYYGNHTEAIENNIVQGMLTVFADKYNLAAAAMKSDPSKVATILSASGNFGDFIQEKSLTKDKQPRSIDYYSIVMSTMIAFYSCTTAIGMMREERVRHTAVRLHAAPIARGSVFAGKVIGTTVVSFVSVCIVVLFSHYIFGADWGNGNYVAIGLVLLTEVVLAVSVGLTLSYLFKEGNGRAFTMIFLQIFSFLGGAYFPVDDGAGLFQYIPYLSPMRWANQGIMHMIYGHSAGTAMQVIALNIGFSAVLLILSGIIMRKQEAI